MGRLLGGRPSSKFREIRVRGPMMRNRISDLVVATAATVATVLPATTIATECSVTSLFMSSTACVRDIRDYHGIRTVGLRPLAGVQKGHTTTEGGSNPTEAARRNSGQHRGPEKGSGSEYPDSSIADKDRGDSIQCVGEKVFRADCNAGFIKNKCVGCHDLQGHGELRQNLTPRGLEYLKRNLGCTAALATIFMQDRHGTDFAWKERIQAVRNHFREFLCQGCHDVDGRGRTRAGLTSYGLAMHESGMGCIACFNMIKSKAHCTDLLPVPRLH